MLVNLGKIDMPTDLLDFIGMINNAAVVTRYPEDFRKMDLRQRLEVLGIAAARIMKPIEARGYTPAEVKSAPKISFLSEVLRLGLKI